MNISFSFQTRNVTTEKKASIRFGAGLSNKFVKEIHNTDIAKISNRLTEKGIATDFKGNNVIAWCCVKTVDIFQQLNERFGLKLALPKGIFVEDFDKLNVDNPNMYGFCNLAPTLLKKESTDIIPSRTLFFNNFYNTSHQDLQWLHNWNNLNKIADYNYNIELSSTDHFLDLFIHEFAHVAHEDRLINKFGGRTLAKKLESINNIDELKDYQRKYGSKIAQICNYATTSPLEAIACDISKLIVSSLDKESLTPIKNPFINSPYEKLSLLRQLNKVKHNNESPLAVILRNFWNGKFD